MLAAVAGIVTTIIDTEIFPFADFTLIRGGGGIVKKFRLIVGCRLRPRRLCTTILSLG